MMMWDFDDEQTVPMTVAMPALPSKSLHTDKLRISPVRWRALHASMRATALLEAPQQPLKSAMQSVFMTASSWFHAHLETPMGPGLASALHRIRDAGQGLFVSQNALFVSLRQVTRSPAGEDASVTNAVQMAEQALLSKVIQ